MSHFSAIGFSVETQDEYSWLIDKVLPLAVPHSTHDKLSYLRYTDPSGAEIWLCGDNDTSQIVCATPCFLPTTTQKVGINTVVPIENGQFGDGTAHGWLNVHKYSEQNGWEDGDYPIIIDLPDYLNHQASSQILSAQLTLFAENVDIYANEDEFEYSQEQQGLNFSSEFFSPSGMFVEENNSATPSAQILAALTVVASEKRCNTLTDTEFYWCRVTTYGGEYEAVYPIDMFNELPKVGNIIFGNYWLTGRFAS